MRQMHNEEQRATSRQRELFKAGEAHGTRILLVYHSNTSAVNYLERAYSLESVTVNWQSNHFKYHESQLFGIVYTSSPQLSDDRLRRRCCDISNPGNLGRPIYPQFWDLCRSSA
ncbi:hypothetical protein OPQ81_002685 [Rhizoctonia solani]|nr:hypothetical protein OPQ81_002685 [Rhizoctonia solani]